MTSSEDDPHSMNLYFASIEEKQDLVEWAKKVILSIFYNS